MKNILLLTDFSNTSKDAIDYALNLFVNEHCTFYLLYVQNSSTYTTDDLVSNASSSVYDSLIYKNRLKLANHVVDLKTKWTADNFIFKTIVDFDSITSAVNQCVKSNQIDLIVMGTNGATGAQEVIFGSNTLKVIREVACTTLIIPENFRYVRPKQMLLALDTSDVINSEVFTDISQFLHGHRVKLHVLRITSEGDDYLDNVDHDYEKLNDFLGENYTYIRVKDIPMEHAVENYLQINNIDVLGLIVQKESFFERLFKGSATTKINQHASLPLFIFHA